MRCINANANLLEVELGLRNILKVEFLTAIYLTVWVAKCSRYYLHKFRLTKCEINY